MGERSQLGRKGEFPLDPCGHQARVNGAPEGSLGWRYSFRGLWYEVAAGGKVSQGLLLCSPQPCVI